MLHVRDFLLTRSFNELSAAHGINVRPCVSGVKWALNYDQIASKPGDPVANQCRGLIIRPTNKINNLDQIVGEFTIVARPMDRFYNAGDVHAANIDWNTARIEEKLDGTMCVLYFDELTKTWCVATRAVPEADLPFSDAFHPLIQKNTFYELFKLSVIETLKHVYGVERSFDEWCSLLERDSTYVYELTSPLNRIVVRYEEFRVTLLAQRKTASGEYVSNHVVGPDGPALLLPQEWKLNDIDALVAFVNNSDPAKIEGAVVVDNLFNRIKVKNKTWVLASRAKDIVTLSKRNALESVINGTIDDVIPLLDKEIVDHVEDVRQRLVKYCTNVDSEYKNLWAAANGDRKAFALAVKEAGVWQTPYFSMLKGGTCLDWLKKLSESEKLTPTMLDALLERI